MLKLTEHGKCLYSAAYLNSNHIDFIIEFKPYNFEQTNKIVFLFFKKVKKKTLCFAKINVD